MFDKIFTWWNGATPGTFFTIGRRGVLVGKDEQGNKYWEERVGSFPGGGKRRWVTYHGVAEGSRVPPDWHGWMHRTFDEPPTTAPLARKGWEKGHLPNMTGTPLAYRPKGSLARPGGGVTPERDYEAWTPDGG